MSLPLPTAGLNKPKHEHNEEKIQISFHSFLSSKALKSL